jgi:hypothetical protein
MSHRGESFQDVDGEAVVVMRKLEGHPAHDDRKQ